MKIISVDFQKDFTVAGGACYKYRPSVGFVKKTLIPYLTEKQIKIAEIISDYRQPRHDIDNLCVPGAMGFESEIPESVKVKPVWIKCMNSPIWVRDGIGVKNAIPGFPYQNPKFFDNWLSEVVGSSQESRDVVLFGLTLDCCVLSCAQELDFRGYNVMILSEATDVYSGDASAKKYLLANVPLRNWAKPISFKELIKKT